MAAQITNKKILSCNFLLFFVIHSLYRRV